MIGAGSDKLNKLDILSVLRHGGISSVDRFHKTKEDFIKINKISYDIQISFNLGIKLI